MIDLDAYLQRIAYRGDREPTFATLRGVLWAHVCSIPFENLSPYTGRPVSLGLDDLQRKLVGERRGGYCYEHNTLLAAVLEALGFTVVPMLARVRWQVPEEVATGRSHLCLRVPVDGAEWLVDAGFGGMGATAPLRLGTESVQDTPHERRRLLSSPDGTVLHQMETTPGEWADVFRAELTRVYPVDVEAANWFTSTHPESWFRSALIVSLVQPDHRRVLCDREFLRRYCDGRVERRLLNSLAELREALVMEFGLPAEHPVMERLTLPSAEE